MPPTTTQPAESRARTRSSTACEPLSPQARRSPEDGGYRRLDRVGIASLRGAIDDAHRKSWTRNVRIGGRAFNAVGAVIHDLHEDLVACARAADPGVQSAHYRLRVTIGGHINVGAVVDRVTVKRLEAAPDAPTTEVATSAQDCIEELLTMIELPPSDGPGEVEGVLETDERCVAHE